MSNPCRCCFVSTPRMQLKELDPALLVECCTLVKVSAASLSAPVRGNVGSIV